MKVPFENIAVTKLLKSLERIEFGSMAIDLPNGQHEEFQGSQIGPSGHLQIFDAGVVRRAAISGDIAFAEDYRRGLWTSRDLPALIECGIRNKEHFRQFINGSKIFASLVKLGYLFRLNTKRGSKRNIHAHYDLGNDFYALWLDRSMTYSSAVYRKPDDDLYTAQMHKYDRILKRLQGTPKNILEIGCGWGGFAERATQTSDHQINGITISDAQHAYAERRLKPLSEHARVHLQDYRDVKGKYDGIVSIEMFEAVGERYWKSYFEKISSLLAYQGKAVIQTITIADQQFEQYRQSGDAIRSYIFPGGMLPSPERFIARAGEAGLKISDRFHFGKDYAQTMRCWLQEFDAQSAAMEAQNFDQSFQRLWRFYLASCIGAFEAGHTDVMQIELSHA